MNLSLILVYNYFSYYLKKIIITIIYTHLNSYYINFTSFKFKFTFNISYFLYKINIIFFKSLTVFKILAY